MFGTFAANLVYLRPFQLEQPVGAHPRHRNLGRHKYAGGYSYFSSHEYAGTNSDR